jgi:adenylate cyclase
VAPAPASGELRGRVIRHAKLFGAIWAILVAIDVASGAPFWAHWPGTALAALVALEAAPLFVGGWFKIQYARGAVIVGALALVNLFSWSGDLWVIWPAGALVAIEVIRRAGARSR